MNAPASKFVTYTRLHYGRLANRNPEGPNIGLINSLAVYSAPTSKITASSKPRTAKVGDAITDVWISTSAIEEGNYRYRPG